MKVIMLALPDLQEEVWEALQAQAWVDEHGVLGVPMSLDGLTWGRHWDATAIDEAIDEACLVEWIGTDLRVCGRYEASALHFRVYPPETKAMTSPDALRAVAGALLPAGCGGSLAWEVTAADGQVLVRHEDVELVQDVYHHAASGARLRRVIAAAGHLAQAGVAA